MPESIRRSIQILATHRALFGARGKARARLNEQDISRVIAVFEANGAAWVLVGAHAVGILTEPRATTDFKFIVETRKLDGILRDLAGAFGELDAREIGAAIELTAIDIDLIRSTNHALFQEALREVRTLGDWKLPRTEVLIALKFLAAISPWRDRVRKTRDISDLTALYLAGGSASLDREEAIRLGGLAYPGAERELRDLFDRIDRGDPLLI